MPSRHAHRYPVRIGGGKPVEMVLVATVEDIEAENARLREEKSDLRDLLARAQTLFPLENIDGEPEWIAAIKNDVRRTLAHG